MTRSITLFGFASLSLFCFSAQAWELGYRYEQHSSKFNELLNDYGTYETAGKPVSGSYTMGVHRIDLIDTSGALASAIGGAANSGAAQYNAQNEAKDLAQKKANETGKREEVSVAYSYYVPQMQPGTRGHVSYLFGSTTPTIQGPWGDQSSVNYPNEPLKYKAFEAGVALSIWDIFQSLNLVAGIDLLMQSYTIEDQPNATTPHLVDKRDFSSTALPLRVGLEFYPFTGLRLGAWTGFDLAAGTDSTKGGYRPLLLSVEYALHRLLVVEGTWKYSGGSPKSSAQFAVTDTVTSLALRLNLSELF